MIDGRKFSICATEAVRQTALRRVPEERMSYHQSHADQTLPETLTAFREVTLILSRFRNITVFCFFEQVYVVSIAVGLETRKKSLALEDHTSQANARALSPASFDGTINKQPSSQNSANGFVEMLSFLLTREQFLFHTHVVLCVGRPNSNMLLLRRKAHEPAQDKRNHIV